MIYSGLQAFLKRAKLLKWLTWTFLDQLDETKYKSSMLRGLFLGLIIQILFSFFQSPRATGEQLSQLLFSKLRTHVPRVRTFKHGQFFLLKFLQPSSPISHESNLEKKLVPTHNLYKSGSSHLTNNFMPLLPILFESTFEIILT